MANTNISGTSFTMNDEFNLSTSKITIKGKAGERLPDLRNKPVVLPIQASSFIPGLLGSLPVAANPNTAALSPVEKAALAAVAVAGRIAVNPVPGGFNLDYLPSLLKVTNGSYQRSGVLSAQDLEKLILALMSEMMAAAGPARNMLSQLLKQALEAAVLPAALKGVQQNCCSGGDPVNLNTGNFVYEKEDIYIQARVPLSFRRFYNKADTREGCMGLGWRHNYEIELIEDAYSYTIIWQDGREEIYRKREDGTIESLWGNPGCLERSKDGFFCKTQEGIGCTFDTKGRMLRQELNGNGLKFNYNKQGRLECVSNNTGCSLFFYYQSSDGHLAEVVDQAGRKVRLDYELGRLKQVTNAMGERYAYIYDEKKSIQRIKNPVGIAVLDNEYDSTGRTIRQCFADGGIITYDYEDADSRTLMTEQNGNRIAYVHDEQYRNAKTIYIDGEENFLYNVRNQLIQKTDKNGNKVKFSYDDKGNTSQVLFPNGSKHNMTYDANNRLLTLSMNGIIRLKNTYDTKGNLIMRSDALGRCREMEYDGQGNATKLTQPDGSIICLKYDSDGNVINVSDGAGNETAYEYDKFHRVICTTDGNGYKTRFTYDECGRIACVINAEGNRRTYEYTKNGKVKKEIDFNGGVTAREYNKMNQLKTVTWPDGGVVCMEYDLMQNITRKMLPDGSEYRYAYSLLNRLEQMTLPTGGVICFEYDTNGNRTAMIDANGNKTSMEYDELNRISAVIKANGAKTEYGYDMDGNLISITNSAGESHLFRYDEAGQKVSETDMLGNIVTYEYNELGKITCITDPKKQKLAYEYEKGGALSRIRYPNGAWETYAYDYNGNLTRRENHKGDFLEYQYDCMNRVVKMSSCIGWGYSYGYDAAGNIIFVTDANGNTTEYEYSLSGNLIGVIDAVGNKTEYAYDGNNHMIAEFPHMGKVTMMGRDGMLLASNSLIGTDTPRITRYDYNGLGKVTRILDPMGNEETYEYDLMGQLTRKTDREGFHTSYAYTECGQLDRMTYDDGRSMELSYNALCQLTQIKDWLGITTIESDTAGRIEKITDHAGRTIRYQWGKDREPEAIYYPDGRIVSYKYDDLGRLSHLKDGETVVAYQYNADGLLTDKMYGDHLHTLYTYDAANRVASLTHCINESVLEKYSYSYDSVGNRIKTRKNKETYCCHYDALNRLVKVVQGDNRIRTYKYDIFGNRVRHYDSETQVEQTYTYNVLNQLLACGRVNYQYDRRGNLIGITKEGLLISGYQYDETNRLAKSFNDRGVMASYQYNGLGDRISRSEYRIDTNIKREKIEAVCWDLESNAHPSKEVDYLLDLTKRYGNLLAKEETIGQTKHCQNYIWDSNVVSMTEDGSAYIYLKDELGSPIGLFDSQGNCRTAYAYDEFGRDMSDNQGKVQPFGYAGYLKDEVTGTYFAQAREYIPEAGCFSAADLIRGKMHLPYSRNRYSYCYNNPYRYLDLDGKIPNPIEIIEKANEYSNEVIQETVRKITNTEITDMEANLIRLDPVAALKVLRCGKLADEWTDKIFSDHYQDVNPNDTMGPHWEDGDAANAYRHAMWNALLTQALSSQSYAGVWATAHEAWSEEELQAMHGGGFTRGEHSVMDLYNNAAGRSCVEWYEFYTSQETISNRVLEKLKKGELVYIIDNHWYDAIIGCPSAQ